VPDHDDGDEAAAERLERALARIEAAARRTIPAVTGVAHGGSMPQAAARLDALIARLDAALADTR